MTISSINRDQGIAVNIVRINTSDDLATITASGYLADQAATIEELNNGSFEWVDNDVILMTYDGGKSFFSRDSDGDLSLTGSGMLNAQVDIALADFIGSNTASVALLPAPGEGKKIVLHRATLHIDYGGTVLADGGTVQIQYADDANAGGTFATNTQAAADLIGATADTSFGFTPVDTTLTDATTLNEGLFLSTATADFTSGTGSAYKVDLWYSVVDVA